MTSLSTLQKQVHVAKDKKNDFGGYNYRTAEGILSAIKAQLPEGAHIVVSDTMQELAGQIFVTATATLYLPDVGEYSATGHALHPLTKKGMDPSQITGSASSYARKYALSGLMAIDDGSADPDAAKAPYEEDLPPPFNAAACESRLRHEMTKLKTKQARAAFWMNEKPAFGAIKDADDAAYQKLRTDLGALVLVDDAAHQAPPQDGHVYG
jgi:hypothetical protein